MTRVALGASLLAIVGLTLLPSHDAKIEPMWRCLVCGEHGVADVIRNIALFLPFGVVLGFAHTRLWRALVIGAILSTAIELAQLWIPGRDSSVSDVMANTLGTTIGCMLPGAWNRMLRLDDRQIARLTIVAAGLVCGITAGTGFLLRPAFPRSVYYGMWTPDLGHLERYRGVVLDAQLGPMTIPSARLDSAPAVARLLTAGAPLRVHALAGPSVPRLAALVSVYDDSQREIFLLGPDREDLVFRYRTRSTAWRFEQPDLRVSGALAGVRSGDTLHVTVWRDSAGYCLARNAFLACRLGFTAGRGWSLLLFPQGLPRWLMGILDASWIAALLVPVGFCARRRSIAWAGAALLAGLVVAPALAGLRPSPAGEWLAAMAGVLIGMRLRKVALGTVAGVLQGPAGYSP